MGSVLKPLCLNVLQGIARKNKEDSEQQITAWRFAKEKRQDQPNSPYLPSVGDEF